LKGHSLELIFKFYGDRKYNKEGFHYHPLSLK